MIFKYIKNILDDDKTTIKINLSENNILKFQLENILKIVESNFIEKLDKDNIERLIDEINQIIVLAKSKPLLEEKKQKLSIKLRELDKYISLAKTERINYPEILDAQNILKTSKNSKVALTPNEFIDLILEVKILRALISMDFIHIFLEMEHNLMAIILDTQLRKESDDIESQKIPEKIPSISMNEYLQLLKYNFQHLPKVTKELTLQKNKLLSFDLEFNDTVEEQFYTTLHKLNETRNVFMHSHSITLSSDKIKQMYKSVYFYKKINSKFSKNKIENITNHFFALFLSTGYSKPNELILEHFPLNIKNIDEDYPAPYKPCDIDENESDEIYQKVIEREKLGLINTSSSPEKLKILATVRAVLITLIVEIREELRSKILFLREKNLLTSEPSVKEIEKNNFSFLINIFRDQLSEDFFGTTFFFSQKTSFLESPNSNINRQNYKKICDNLDKLSDNYNWLKHNREIPLPRIKALLENTFHLRDYDVQLLSRIIIESLLFKFDVNSPNFPRDAAAIIEETNEVLKHFNIENKKP